MVSGAVGQPYTISGTIEHAEEGEIRLASYYGDRFRIVDSIHSESGFFYFLLSGEDPAGIYRIIYSDRIQGVRTENRFIEFIFNRENMEMVVRQEEQGPVPYFENSVENQVYREFMDFELNYETRLVEVYGQLSPSRPGLEEYETAVTRYDDLQLQRNRFLDSMSVRYPDLYATRIMNALRAPFIPGHVTHSERIDSLQSCFFNETAIDDPLLLYAPVYTFKLIDFLSLFKVDSLSKEAQETRFIEAVDRIMIHVSQDAELRSFVVEFLLEGFELLDMEQVQIHLSDHYLDELCEADIVELVRSRMEGYKKLKPGAVAPDFTITDWQEQDHRLSGLDHPYVLVIFWASTCEHCQSMLPKLHAWYQEENNLDLEVVAISIDTSTGNFETYMETHHSPWITSHEPLGWNGKVPGEYFVYATPSVFLLDRDRTILAKPASYRQFLRAVKKLER